MSELKDFQEAFDAISKALDERNELRKNADDYDRALAEVFKLANKAGVEVQPGWGTATITKQLFAKLAAEVERVVHDNAKLVLLREKLTAKLDKVRQECERHQRPYKDNEHLHRFGSVEQTSFAVASQILACLDGEGEGEATCPKCGSNRRIKVGDLSTTGDLELLRCECGYAYEHPAPQQPAAVERGESSTFMGKPYDEVQMPSDNQPSFNAATAAESGEPMEWELLEYDWHRGHFGLAAKHGDATREQAESALRAIQAMDAIEKHKIEVRWDVGGCRCITRWANVDEAYLDTATQSVLALAAQLEQGGAK